MRRKGKEREREREEGEEKERDDRKKRTVFDRDLCR